MLFFEPIRSLFGQMEAPDHLVVEEATVDDNSVVSAHPSLLEKLNTFRGDTVQIKSKTRGTIVIILSDDTIENYNHVRINQVIRDNLDVAIGDFVSIEALEEVPYGVNVNIVPFAETIKVWKINSLILFFPIFFLFELFILFFFNLFPVLLLLFMFF